MQRIRMTTGKENSGGNATSPSRSFQIVQGQRSAVCSPQKHKFGQLSKCDSRESGRFNIPLTLKLHQLRSESFFSSMVSSGTVMPIMAPYATKTMFSRKFVPNQPVLSRHSSAQKAISSSGLRRSTASPDCVESPLRLKNIGEALLHIRPTKMYHRKSDSMDQVSLLSLCLP